MTTKTINYDLVVQIRQDEADPADNRAMDAAELKANVERMIQGIALNKGLNNIRILSLEEK